LAVVSPLLKRRLASKLKCFSHSSGKSCEKAWVFFSMFMSIMAPVNSYRYEVVEFLERTGNVVDPDPPGSDIFHQIRLQTRVFGLDQNQVQKEILHYQNHFFK
jgi:hypothetical protein